MTNNMWRLCFNWRKNHYILFYLAFLVNLEKSILSVITRPREHFLFVFFLQKHPHARKKEKRESFRSTSLLTNKGFHHHWLTLNDSLNGEKSFWFKQYEQPLIINSLTHWNNFITFLVRKCRLRVEKYEGCTQAC